VTDHELLVRIDMRQEALIATISTLTDVLVAVRDIQSEMLELAQEPPSSDLGEVLIGLTGSVDRLADAIAEMPERVATAVRSEV
jgi:hypothetical protein